MKNKIILLTIFSMLLMIVFQSKSNAQNPIKTAPNAKILSKSWKHIVFGTQTEVLQFINGEKGTAPIDFRVASVGAPTTRRISFHVFYQAGLLPNPGKPWQPKRFNSADEALNFINTQTAKEFRICGAISNQPESFFVFYREITGSAPGGWGWKLSETADDVQKFLNREGGYNQYVLDAEVAAVGSNFYVFYKPATPGMIRNPLPSWGWVKRETTDSAVDILNKGTTNVVKMINVARIGAVIEPPYTVFYIFYQ
jgi:hypothetical protein